MEEGDPTVHVFSPEWWGRGAAGGGGVALGGAALLVAWVAREPGRARLAWMETWRAPAALGGNATAGCALTCTALHACMPRALACSGAPDCPGGADEAGACGPGARLLAALGAGGAAGASAGAGAALLALFALGLLAARRRRRGRADKRLLGALAAGRRLTEELLYDASRASSTASS